MGISIRAYARYRGTSDTAVHKAISSGRIALEPDGTIDPEKADQEWELNSEPPRTASRKQSATASAPPGQENEPGPPTGPSLLQARTVNEAVKAQTNKIRLARLKGELIDRNQVLAHVFKLARAERDAWLNWPARIATQMAARLGVDPHTMHVVLENAVREHLQELGELRPRID